MIPSADVVILGGGVIGCAVGYFLATDPTFGGRIVVVERDPAYRRASSALSASSIRQQFTTPENIRISRFGFEFLRDLQRHLAVDGEPPPEIGFLERGYLFLAPPGRRAEGADTAILTPAELTARFPWLDPAGVGLASLGLSGEGWFDGYGLTRAFRRKAVSLGVDFVAAEVVGLRRAGGRIEAVELGDGSAIGTGSVVNAAGPWAARVAAMAGIELPVEARRRSVFVFEAADPPTGCPLVIDTSGAWFRPEGATFIAGMAPAEADDQPDLPLEPDRGAWEAVLWPALATRVPAFDKVRVTGAWAGYYEINTFDHNAILGPHPEVANLLFANGFSGHGIQQAPAVGRAIAERIAHGRFVSLDLGVFGFERIAAGRRVVERNVIG